MNVIEFAKMVAVDAHKDQFRRDGITPYINHVETVVANVIKRNGTPEMIATAWWHDLSEDCGEAYSIDNLRINFFDECGITNDIINAVDALTHRKGESYMESIARAKANPIARSVKIADNLANLSDSPTDKQIVKYAKSLQVLMRD